MKLEDINTQTEEGKMLVAALSVLTTTESMVILKRDINGRTKTPDEMLGTIKEVRDVIYTETLEVHKKGDGWEIIVTHDQSGSAYGTTLSQSAYEQLREYFAKKVQLCYSDNQTYCECPGLCRNK